MLTDSVSRKENAAKAVVKQDRRELKRKKSWISDKRKLEAVHAFLLSGSVMGTAAALNISINTLKNWKTKDWWKELVEETRATKSMQLSRKLSTLRDVAWDQLADRLEHGDVHITKDGKIIRKAVPARDLHKIALETAERSDTYEQQPGREQTQARAEDVSAKILASFEAITSKLRDVSKKEKKTIEVTDVIVGTPSE